MSWPPSSSCGPRCLPVYRQRVGMLRRTGRLAAFGCLFGVAVAVLPVWTLLSPQTRRRALRSWARRVLTALGIEVTGSALPASGAGTGRLIVANHTSWLDVLAVLAVAPSSLLAKREVRRWPVIGLLALRVGTLFIDRHRMRTLPATVDAITARLRRGDDVAVFPEGTTWCGAHTGHWYPATFQAALAAGAAVQPLRLKYWAPGQSPATVAAFLGTEALLPCLGRVVAARGLTLDIGPAVPIPPRAYPGPPRIARRELARRAAAARAPRARPEPAGAR